MRSVNPYNGEEFAQYPTLGADELESKLQAAHDARAEWKGTPVSARAALLARAAEVLDARQEELARLATREMGKTLEAARQEVAKCALVCRFYAENAVSMLEPRQMDSASQRAFVRYDPLGVVLAVMPWNFPYWQAFRFIAPTLVAGNVGLLKHASNVPGCALAIEDVLREAGFPAGVFQTLLIPSREVQRVIEDGRVQAVSLTGSEGAGRAVAGQAGAAIKPSVMELGGSDPFIVLPSADLERAARVAVASRTINNGQSCIAAKRFIVHAAVYDRFEALMVGQLRALTVGDPMDDGTDIGPLATAQIRDELHEQVRDAVGKGARLLCGGELPGGAGYHYPPTALAGLTEDMEVWREETFGPVALLFRVGSAEEALSLANGTRFGLGSSVWTEDEAEQERFITGLEAGAVFVNAMVASDPRLPFGGVKASGFGRELSREGLYAFVNVKTVALGAAEGAEHSKME